MTSITVHAGAYGAVPTAMPAVTTATVAMAHARGIETTVTISGTAYTALEAVEPRSIDTSAQTDSTSHKEGGEDISINNENNDEGGSTRPPPFLPPWMTNIQPHGSEDQPIDDTFSVVNDIDPTTANTQVAQDAKSIVPPLIPSEDGRPGYFPPPLLPPLITSGIPSTTKVLNREIDTDKTASRHSTIAAAPTVRNNGVHDDWWQPPPNWSTHIPHTQPEIKPFEPLSEPTEVVATVMITETLQSTTATDTMDTILTGSATMEPSTLAQIVRPMSTGGVNAESRAQTNGTDSVYPSLVMGDAASLLPAQGPGVVAAEAIALLAGFYVWFM